MGCRLPRAAKTSSRFSFSRTFCVSQSNMEKVVIVTGANSGIGLALCERLLTEDSQLRLCLACRNMQRAEAARANLLASRSSARIDLLHLDVGSVQSVLSAAKEIKTKYSRVDFLYLNAGIMPNPTVDIGAFFKGLFSRNAINMFATAEGLLTQQDRVNSDGLQEVFATNLFGHFLLVRELEPLLCQPGHTSRVVWTSSSNARRSAFSIEDFQHTKGTEPYSSSKYASDLLSLALNRHKNSQGLFSSVTCPGLVMTNLTFGILPSFFWTLIMPIMWMVRVHSLFYMFMCNFPKLLKTFFCFRQTDPNFHQHFYTHPKQWSRGTGVFLSHDLYFYLCSLLFWCLVNAPKIINVHSASLQFWLFLQKPEVLDSRAKYHSLTSGLGTKYTEPRQMDIDDEMSEVFYSKLLELEKTTRRKLKERNADNEAYQQYLNNIE